MDIEFIFGDDLKLNVMILSGDMFDIVILIEKIG